MQCIKCHDKARKNGKTAAGSQRYRCDKCKTSWTDSSNIQGSMPIGIEPMTGRVRVKRHRYRQQVIKEITMSVSYSISEINKNSLEATKGLVVDSTTTKEQLEKIEKLIEKEFLDPWGTKYIFDGWCFPNPNPTRTGWKSVLVHIDKYGDWVQTTDNCQAPTGIYFRPCYKEVY